MAFKESFVSSDCLDTQAVINAFFSQEGPLQKLWPDYHPRTGQIHMARAIAQALKDHRHLVVEAGTGVGKSFAYLAPMLLDTQKNKGPVVISTGTIALQEQLVHKDLPLIARCLNRPLHFMLAKGRNHFLCEHRYRRFQEAFESIAEDEDDLRTLQKMKTLLGRGIISRAKLPGPLSQNAWSQIQSETGLCGHQVCREKPCSYQLMRGELKKADVIVVNHNLLFVHLQLARLGVSILPKFSRIVLDEAHHCPETATEHFGILVSNQQVRYLLDQLYSERRHRGLLARMKPEPALVKKKVVECRAISDGFFSVLRFWLENEAPDNGRIRKPLTLENPLSPALKELQDLLSNWAGTSDNADEEREFRYYAERCGMLGGELDSFLKMVVEKAAYWAESRILTQNRFHTSGRSAPLDVSASLRSLLFDELETVIMTSATLSTGDKNPFAFYRKRMGVPEASRELQVSSPFAYEQQVVLWSTNSIPSPIEKEWINALPLKISELLSWTKGGAFILTTSHAVLRQLYDQLLGEAEQKSYRLLAQGISGDRSQLVTSFREHPNAVLIGNSTFWEGIDIPGPHLRQVIIPRLPFEVPSHPLQEARVEQLSKEGKHPFVEWSLPQALIRFRQGFGRLIRTQSDLGIVSVLDVRLNQKQYGKSFLASLPHCQHLIDEKPDEAFLKKCLPRS